MFMKCTDYENVNDTFCQILKKRRDKSVVKGRIDIEHIALAKKAEFIYNIISSFSTKSEYIYRILFWEKDQVLKVFFKQYFSEIEYTIYQSYQNKQKPGICFVSGDELSKSFFKLLITNHFNYELAKNPSLNIRIQIFFRIKGFNIVFDIYDDRGFYLVWISLNS